MKGPEIQKIEDLNNEKQKSISTSSFYRQTLHRNKNNQSLSHAIQFQERELQQSFSKLKLTIDMKIQHINKRSAQSNEQNEKIRNQMGQLQKSMNDNLKNIQRVDKTKQWAIQMERTIQTVMQNNKDANRKVCDKNTGQCRKLQQSFEQMQSKWREQRKQRQKQWEELITNVGQTILDAETLIQNEKEQMQHKLIQIQRKILDIEQESACSIEVQRATRKHEHQYITKLIQRIMDRLIN